MIKFTIVKSDSTFVQHCRTLKEAKENKLPEERIQKTRVDRRGYIDHIFYWVEEPQIFNCEYCGIQIKSDKLRRGQKHYCAECYIKDNVEN